MRFDFEPRIIQHCIVRNLARTLSERRNAVASPIRRGTWKTLTFDADALLLLENMAPSRKRYGSFLSELLRREWERREVRREVLAELEAVGCDHMKAEQVAT